MEHTGVYEPRFLEKSPLHPRQPFFLLLLGFYYRAKVVLLLLLLLFSLARDVEPVEVYEVDLLIVLQGKFYFLQLLVHKLPASPVHDA